MSSKRIKCLENQINNDIYNILLSMGMYAQHPSFLLTTTVGNTHTVRYPYDEKKGSIYRRALYIKIKSDYDFGELENSIRKIVKKNLKKISEIDEVFGNTNRFLDLITETEEE